MAGERVVLQADEVLAWQKRIYQAAGMRDGDAVTVARHLVTADMRGVYSHGIMRTPFYIRHFQSGGCDPAAVPEVVRRKGSTALVHGRNANGMVAAAFATQTAIDLAREFGSATVSVTGSNHMGTCGYYAEMAAKQDMIGLFWSVSAANNMAPWGGAAPQLGNNPFAVAIPRKSGPAVIMDIATSVVAKGKILMAAKNGVPIPGDWALDATGHPTTDAQAAAEGTLLPMGGYKGYALSFVIGALTCLLNGSSFGPTMADLIRSPGDPLNSGHLVQVMDIAAFSDVDAFKERMDEAVAYLKGGEKAGGVEEILVPGEPEARNYRRQDRDGVTYTPEVIRENRRIADSLRICSP